MNLTDVNDAIMTRLNTLSGVFISSNSAMSKPALPYAEVTVIKGDGYLYNLNGTGGMWDVTVPITYFDKESVGVASSMRMQDQVVSLFSNWSHLTSGGDHITADPDPVSAPGGYSEGGAFVYPILLKLQISS